MRDGLTLPAVSGINRVGNGYVQQLVSGGAASAVYLVTVADNFGTVYFVTGAIVTEYLQLGGPAGLLGYPLADATVAGRQTFQNGALAGNPLQVITGAILADWQSLGYERERPACRDPRLVLFLTFLGTTGNAAPAGNPLKSPLRARFCWRPKPPVRRVYESFQRASSADFGCRPLLRRVRRDTRAI